MAADHPLDWGLRCKHGVILYPSMMDSIIGNIHRNIHRNHCIQTNLMDFT